MLRPYFFILTGHVLGEIAAVTGTAGGGPVYA